MAGKTKAEFIVVRRITRGGAVREPGYVFTACLDGVHVSRWLDDEKIRIVRAVLTDALIQKLLTAGRKGR